MHFVHMIFGMFRGSSAPVQASSTPVPSASSTMYVPMDTLHPNVDDPGVMHFVWAEPEPEVFTPPNTDNPGVKRSWSPYRMIDDPGVRA